MDLSPTPAPRETISAHLRLILRGLLAALGGWRLEPVIALVLYRRVSVTLGRIERMLVRFRAGRLWRVTHRAARAEQRSHRHSVAPLPRRFGWLVQIGGHQAACVGTQIQAVLNAPEMAELLAASVQAQRILRPICRALAVEMPGMIGKAATDSDAAVRRRIHTRTALEPFRVPLPRGVLVAARRAGFGKDR